MGAPTASSSGQSVPIRTACSTSTARPPHAARISPSAAILARTPLFVTTSAAAIGRILTGATAPPAVRVDHVVGMPERVERFARVLCGRTCFAPQHVLPRGDGTEVCRVMAERIVAAMGDYETIWYWSGVSVVI